MEDVRV